MLRGNPQSNFKKKVTPKKITPQLIMEERVMDKT
jgi:hypothetical protein